MPRPVKYQRKLNELGIALDDFHYYWKTFVGYSFPFWKKYDNEGEIFTAYGRNRKPYPVNEYDVLNHLLGKHWVFVKRRDVSPLLCIDIDFKAPNFLKRYHQVVNVLPNPLVFRSSSSGGLHLYYLLKYPQYAKKIHMLIKALFFENGIEERSGRIEIFPGVIDHLRLPLGEGSCLLDPESLEPLDMDLYDSIGVIMNHPRIEIPAAKSQGVRSPKPGHEVLVPTGLRVEKALDLLESGLTKLGTRHASQLLLIQYFMLDLGLSALETETKLISWLNRFSHVSSDWRDDPTKVEQEIRAQIENFSGKIRIQSTFKSIPLTKLDVANILKKFGDNQPWGAEQFRQQEFMFNLLSWYKDQNKKPVDLAFNFVRKFGGASQKTAGRRIRFCEELGILEKVRSHDRFKRQSRQYLIHFDYGDDTEVSSFSAGLNLLFTKSEISKMYSRSVARKITLSQTQGPINRE